MDCKVKTGAETQGPIKLTDPVTSAEQHTELVLPKELGEPTDILDTTEQLEAME